jgi:hypothetical protein
MKSVLLFIAITISSLSSFAFLPSADFIFSKVVKNAGTGVYLVKQEVTFPTAQRNITVTETWWIQNDDLMFLKAEGPLFTQYFLYKKGRRYSFNSNGQVQASSIPADFHEGLFFKRSSQDLKESLVSRKLLPAQTFRKRPMIKTSKDVADLAAINEPYLKLSRLNGTINYLMGYAAAEEGAPGIWIEQDRFAIKKIKLPSKSEMTADSFSELSRNLVYPKSQKISWDNQYVQIELSRADALNKGVDFFDEAQFSKLQNQNKPLPPEWAQSVVGDFYKRFR